MERVVVTCHGADAVWVCGRNDASGGKLYGAPIQKETAPTPPSFADEDGAAAAPPPLSEEEAHAELEAELLKKTVSFPITFDTRKLKDAPFHFKLTLMRWKHERYELEGGLVFAIGESRTTRLDPTDFEPVVGSASTAPRDDEPGLFDLATAPVPAPTTRLTPTILLKDTPNDQWHDGNVVEMKELPVDVRVTMPGVAVWDVSETYKNIADTMISDTKTRVNAVFTANQSHAGRDAGVAVEQRGFLRQSVWRPDFPGFASPGGCMQECSANRIDVPTYDNLVLSARLITGFDEVAFYKLVGIGSPPSADQDDTRSRRPADSAFFGPTAALGPDQPHGTYAKFDAALSTKIHELMTESGGAPSSRELQLLRVVEALAVVLLGLGGSHYGYNAEKADDQSIPTIKCGSNSDCEDFAIAAAALVQWMRSERGMMFVTHSTTIVGRLLAWFIRNVFVRAFVVTGFVDLSIARPDMPSTKEHMSGHGWTMVELWDGYRPSGLKKSRWFVIECTSPFVPHSIPAGVPIPGMDVDTVAATNPAYAEMRDANPDMDKEHKKDAIEMLARQTTGWIAAACGILYGDVLLLVRNTAIDGIKGKIGPAHFMDVDKHGIPYKYRTVATLSDAFDSYAVTSYTPPPRPADGGDTPVTVAYARSKKAWQHNKPVSGVYKARATHDGEHPLPPPGRASSKGIDSDDRCEVSVTLAEFMANTFEVRRVFPKSTSAAYDVYFRPFMVNPYLSSGANSNLRDFIEKVGGLRSRRIAGAHGMPPEEEERYAGKNKNPARHRQLVLPSTWVHTRMAVNALPRLCVGIVPAVEFNAAAAGTFAATTGIGEVLYYPMRFLFGDMIAFGVAGIPLIARIAPLPPSRVQYRRAPTPPPAEPRVARYDQEHHMMSLLKQHHAGYKPMLEQRAKP
jgi:hypothetical protein